MIKKVKSSSFIGSILVLVGGNTIAQLISFISLPILQRWFYNPAEFGLLAVYNSITTVLIALSTIKLEYAIILSKSEENSIAIRNLTTKIVRYFSFFVFVIIIIWGSTISRYLGFDQIGFYLYLIPINILFAGTYEAYNYWYNYKKDYKTIAVSKIIQSSIAELFKYLTQIFFAFTGGLIIGRLLGQISSSLSLVLNKKSSPKNTAQKKSGFSKILKEHRKFPQYVLPTVFVNMLANSILILFISKSFGSYELGLVSASILYLQAPLGILSRSVSQVFYKKISEVSDYLIIRKIYLKASFSLSIIVIILVIIIVLIPNHWFQIILGQKWKGIGVYMNIMVFWIAISFVTSSLSFIYNRIQKQKTALVFSLAQLLGVFLSLWFSIEYFRASLKTTLIVYSTFQGVYYFSTLFLALIYLKKQSS